MAAEWSPIAAAWGAQGLIGSGGDISSFLDGFAAGHGEAHADDRFGLAGAATSQVLENAPLDVFDGLPTLLTPDEAAKLALAQMQHEEESFGHQGDSSAPMAVDIAVGSPTFSLGSRSFASSAACSQFSRRSELRELARRHRLEALRRSREAENLAECSFQPNVSDLRSGAPGGGLSPSASAALAARLCTSLPTEPRRTADALLARRRREEEALRECTFAPDLSLSSSSVRLHGAEFSRSASSDSLAAGARRRRRQEPSRSPSPPHRPHTNELAPNMEHAKVYLSQDVFTRLTRPPPPPPGFSEAPVGAEENDAASPTWTAESSFYASDVGAGTDPVLLRFLRRQNEHEEERLRRLDELQAALAPRLRPSLSARSLRLAERRGAGRASSRSVERSAGHGESAAAAEMRFAPAITAAAAALPPRSFEDMSMGDAMRRELRAKQLREQLWDEERQLLPFAPELNSAPPGARGALRVLEEPDAYVPRLREAQRRALARTALEQQRREKEALEQCTFKPKVNGGAPRFVRRLAERHRMAKESQAKGAEAAMLAAGGAQPEWR